MSASPSVLPVGTLPRGFSRAQAAEYVGVSIGTFDKLVAEGRMPKALRIGSRLVWDQVKVNEAFTALADDDPNPWDEAVNDND